MKRVNPVTILATIAWLSITGAAMAQAPIEVKNNQPLRAKLLGNQGESHLYIVELKGNANVLEFRAVCETTDLVIELHPVGGGKQLTLLDGKNNTSIADRPTGKNLNLHTRPLAAGKYRISVTGKKMGAGEYALTVTAPKLVAVKPKGGDGKVEELEKRLERVEKALERLEKLLEKK